MQSRPRSAAAMPRRMATHAPWALRVVGCGAEVRFGRRTCPAIFFVIAPFVCYRLPFLCYRLLFFCLPSNPPGYCCCSFCLLWAPFLCYRLPPFFCYPLDLGSISARDRGGVALGIAGRGAEVRVAVEPDPRIRRPRAEEERALYSYGLYSHGLYSYGLYSYGLHSYGRVPSRPMPPSPPLRTRRPPPWRAPWTRWPASA